MKTIVKDTLEFNQILLALSQFALSQRAGEKLLELKPLLSERECKAKMLETTEARYIMDTLGSAPLSSMKELGKSLELVQMGDMLIPEQFAGITSFIYACRRMKSYLKKAEDIGVGIAFYGGAFSTLEVLYGEIDRSIRNGAIDSGASGTLRDIRRKTETVTVAMKAKLESILRSKKEWFVDGYVATRGGRFVLPVKKEYKNQVNGSVIDTSSTGSTYFIEPTAVRKLQDELDILLIEEENEIRRILYTLTALVHEHMNTLKINMDCMETLDLIFAKAKLSAAMKAIPVSITTDRRIKIVAGRHPLLVQERCVPLDFEIGGGVSGVVITGPNTGGKTVALKTVGLLSLMAQSGLHVPASEGSVFSMHANVLSDIGDGQSITENLSTFSAHITNIIDILKNVSCESLVLLDELGSGTDPAEGMGLAVAILSELKKRGCLFVATTHYPEIKDYAKRTDRLINARMAFDRESLQPLYKLEIGEAGESCALYIARRLGFPEDLLKRAYTEAYASKSERATSAPEMVFYDTAATEDTPTHRQIKKEAAPRATPLRSASFNIGDSVTVYPQKEIGIICARADEKGELGVQVKGKKLRVNHKRIKLLAPASELYPADYDFSIVFDSVENRKNRRVMDKRHAPDLVLRHEKDEIK